MNKLSADKDSLVALDALLRIKGSGGKSPPVKKAEVRRAPTSCTLKNDRIPPRKLEIEPTTRSVSPEGTQGQSSSKKSKSMSLQASNSSPHVRGGSLLLPQMNGAQHQSCSQAQLAALQAAGVAAAAAATFGNSFTAAGGRGGPNFHHHAAAAAAAHQLLSRQAAVAAAERQKQNLKNETSADSGAAAAAAALVRKEKVEAALRSKPQRGRKREDLSEKERLELTRTRNREHAKSTRIRKKARYQELLDCEQKLQELSKMETLRRKRSDSITNFLSIRQRMVNSAAAGADSTHYTSTVNALDEVVCSISNFQYESFSTSAESRRSSRAENNGSNSDLVCMKEWDTDFVKRVTQCYGPGAERFVEFKAIGGTDGIALSKDGSGFAHVEIVLNINESRLLVTATLSFQFAPESDQIRSASWTTVHEYCAPLLQEKQEMKRSRESSSVGGDLCNHFVHPSVISLDADKTQYDEAVNSGMHGPGMSI